MNSKLSWEQIGDLVKKLGEEIKKSGFKPDYLIGITTGGLIPLYFISKELDIDNIVTVSASSYQGREQRQIEVTYLPTIDLAGKNILLVDEVSETGQTLQHVANLLKEKYRPGELRTAVLVQNVAESKFSPDYVAREADTWVVFPWEKEEE